MKIKQLWSFFSPTMRNWFAWTVLISVFFFVLQSFNFFPLNFILLYNVFCKLDLWFAWDCVYTEVLIKKWCFCLNFFFVFRSFWCANVKKIFFKIKKNIILMHFRMKKHLKNNHYHTHKHPLIFWFSSFYMGIR